MSDEMYPWPGGYKKGNETSPVAVVTLGDEFQFDPEKVAIWGPMKTENLGIEKVVANTVSNPNIRFLIICGEEIRGHKSGRSLIKLVENGIDGQGRIVCSPGAVPYIENISEDAVERFRDQVEVIDMVGEVNKSKLEEMIDELLEEEVGAYGEPYKAVSIEKKESSKFKTDFALHSSLKVSPWGEISPFGTEVE